MLQDIEPHNYHNEYSEHFPGADSIVFVFRGNTVLVRLDQAHVFPTWEEVYAGQETELLYLFSIDQRMYFWAEGMEPELDGYEYKKVRELRELVPREACFAVATAYHLQQWYLDNRYCGRCGRVLCRSGKERSLYCTQCGNTVYPKIAPAVIVAVTDRNRIVMTKYAGREYQRYALIAGFCEIGETAEDTVRREVMEEVGLKVKNLRYYKSQPWGFDSNLLMGFFAELDGDDTIVRQEDELSVAEWKSRTDAVGMDDGISLTREMMRIFAEGEEVWGS